MEMDDYASILYHIRKEDEKIRLLLVLDFHIVKGIIIFLKSS